MTEQHDMVLEETKSTGDENWYCPTCGRRLLITWQPWKRVVVEQGDLHAAHSASKGGLKLGTVYVKQGDQLIGSADSGPAIDDPSLAPWQRWLDKTDPDDLWNREP
jgi:hypothetical protein